MKTKIKKYKLLPPEKQRGGECGACGSHEIDYPGGDNVYDDSLIGYRYHCRSCGVDGVEYSTVEFSHHELDEDQ
jgi:hypothetical protein